MASGVKTERKVNHMREESFKRTMMADPAHTSRNSAIDYSGMTKSQSAKRMRKTKT
jgi:hypothetical protein